MGDIILKNGKEVKYMYEDIGEVESTLGYQMSEGAKMAWGMARQMVKVSTGDKDGIRSIGVLQVNRDGRWIDLYEIREGRAESSWGIDLVTPGEKTELRIVFK